MARTHGARGPSATLAAVLALLATACGTEDPGTSAGRIGPPGADGCRANSGWTARDQAAWLRPAVSFSPDAVILAGIGDAHDGAPLCRPVTVRVEFWRLTARSTDVQVTSVQRTRLRTDGRDDHRIGLPPALDARGRDACTGVLMAAYTGTPLTGKDLPENLARAVPDRSADLDFRTERIAAHRLIPPSAPGACPGDEKAPAGPTATPNPWGDDHP